MHDSTHIKNTMHAICNPAVPSSWKFRMILADHLNRLARLSRDDMLAAPIRYCELKDGCAFRGTDETASSQVDGRLKRSITTTSFHHEHPLSTGIEFRPAFHDVRFGKSPARIEHWPPTRSFRGIGLHESRREDFPRRQMTSQQRLQAR